MTLIDDLTALITEWHEAVPALTEKDRGRGWTLDACADELAQLIARNNNPLTPRHLNMLTQLALGATTRQLADSQHLSLGGINYHVKAIHRAYRVNTTVQAVTAAIRAGHLNPNNITGEWVGHPPTDGRLRILQAVADHGTNEAAAKAANVTRSTVATQLHRMTIEAGESTKVRLVVLAFKKGWVE